MVRVEDCQPIQGFEIDFGGMDVVSLIRAVGSGDKLRAVAASDICLKNVIGIVKIGHYEIALGKIIGHVLGELAVTGEKAGKRARVNRLRLVCQTAGHGQFDDMRITQHFQVRLGKLLSQGGDCRQGQNKISDRAAANDENLAAKRVQNFAAPKTATNKPNASLMPQPTFTRFSLAVPHSSKSRSRQGETVNQMPPTTST